MSATRRWRGLAAMVRDGVESAASAVEQVHLATAARPFDALERIPPLALPARGVRALHDATVAGVYGAIRLVTRAVGGTLDVVLDAVEREGAPPPAESREHPG